VLERVRRVLLALGDRLVAADTLERRDDVVLLTLAELREALGGMASGAAIGAAVTRRRRADLVHAVATETSPTLGAPPAGPPADTFAGRMIVDAAVRRGGRCGHRHRGRARTLLDEKQT